MKAPQIPGWQDLLPIERAQAVIDWCQNQKPPIETGAVLAHGLFAALEEKRSVEWWDGGPTVTHSPVDYVHMIRILVAYGRAR